VTETTDLVALLRRAGLDDVSDSVLTRALYSSDASLYRVVPQAVARPRDRDEVLAAVQTCRDLGVPLTLRGAGTSIAGNAVGLGLVLDTSRHLDQVLSLSPEEQVAVVQPGTVHATLQRAASAHGLRFGPDPSTHSRCTVGGMVGNNACGSRALGWGRTSDNVVALEVVWGNGETGSAASSRTGAALAELVAGDLAHVRTTFGRFSRQVSGYALEHLLPEQRRPERFLAGSEGTLAVVLEATVRLVPEPAARRLVVLGYPSMAEAADAVPGLLPLGPVACEGLDARLVDLVRRTRPVPDLPRGRGWLFVEVTGDSAAEADARVPAVVAGGAALDSRLVSDPDEAAALWRIREDGAGLAAISLDRPAYSGWEDAAVPPDRLGAWLRDFEELLAAHGLSTVPYGHFGDGCVHARIDFDLASRGRFRDFLVAAATRLREHGGSLSGEHGDGRARSELLPLMYDDASLGLFARVKAVADPDGLLNPGVLVDPAPVDADLRAARERSDPPVLLTVGGLGAAHRCTGVGRCVATTGPGVMCPSFAATREEKDSTRGRARVLQEALDGALVRGLDDPAVEEALDLCLACKGCASDCPTGVDLASYKADVLHRTYAGRRRPLSHYTLGRLPSWLFRLGDRPGRANRLLALTAPLAGIDRRRSLPPLAARTARSQATVTGTTRDETPPDVWLWADSFTDAFRPEVVTATTRLLAHLGLDAKVVTARACCGLTEITTGQLDRARRAGADAVDRLRPLVASGAPVVGLEPSCLATLRDDVPRLVPGADEVTGRVQTLAELLTRLADEGAALPDLTGTEVLAQPHCHHHAVLGWETDQALLARLGAHVTRIGGCCGLAGSFGLERGHYEVSVAVAETRLLPALRARPDALVLADGLSCRHQMADLAGRSSMHLAELLALRIGQ